jgi:hypothetical protein
MPPSPPFTRGNRGSEGLKGSPKGPGQDVIRVCHQDALLNTSGLARVKETTWRGERRLCGLEEAEWFPKTEPGLCSLWTMDMAGARPGTGLALEDWAGHQRPGQGAGPVFLPLTASQPLVTFPSNPSTSATARTGK